MTTKVGCREDMVGHIKPKYAARRNSDKELTTLKGRRPLHSLNSRTDWRLQCRGEHKGREVQCTILFGKEGVTSDDLGAQSLHFGDVWPTLMQGSENLVLRTTQDHSCGTWEQYGERIKPGLTVSPHIPILKASTS